MMARAFAPVPEEFVSRTEVFESKTPITSAIKKINKYGAVVVQQKKAYVGMVDTRSIARKGRLKLDPNFAISKFSKKVPILDSTVSLEKAIMNFYNSRAKALPYISDGKVKGIVKRTKILGAMLSLHLLKKYKVLDAMSSPVFAIRTDANISQAKTIMNENRINRLVVIENNGLFGLLTYNNLIEKVAAPSQRAPRFQLRKSSNSALDVASLCERQVHGIESSARIEDALKLMIEKNVSSLLATKKDLPVGMLSIHDILSLYVSETMLQQEKIILSGLDDYTREYEDEVRSSLNSLIKRIEKFKHTKIEHLRVNVKRHKARNYEVRARLVTTSKEVISAASSGYTLESSLDDLVDRLYKTAKQKREVILAEKKNRSRLYEK